MADIQQGLREIQQIGKRTHEDLVHPSQCPALNQFHVRLAGISKTTPEFRFCHGKSEFSQILVSFRGMGRVLLNGEWQPCPAGRAYCTPRGKAHGYTGAHGWEVGWITYEKPAPEAFEDVMLLEVDPRPLEFVLRGLHHESVTRRDPVLLEHWAALLQAHVRRILEERRPARLWKLWQRVHARLAHEWTLAQLAEIAGVSPEYLRRLSLQENGCAPMHHVVRLRMQQAISLLSKGYKIEAVAREVGYENAFAFSTAFKRIMGIPPSRFGRQ